MKNIILFFAFFLILKIADAQLVFKIDSIVWSYRKIINEYDERGNIILRTEYYKYDDNWYVWKKKIKKYDINNNVIFGEEINYQNNNKINFGFKSEFLYDRNNNLLREQFYRYDTASASWKNSYKEEMIYDKKNMLNRESYIWDNTKNDWKNLYKSKHTYDNKGNLIEIVQYNWNDPRSEWLSMEKTENSYNAENIVIKEVYYKIKYVDSILHLREMCEHNYKDGLLENRITYTWNESTQNWINDSKYEQFYDDNENIINSGYFSWDSTSATWFQYARGESVYNESNSCTFSKYERWNSEDSIWELRRLNEKVYDSLNICISESYSAWEIDDPVFRLRYKKEKIIDNENRTITNVYYSYDHIFVVGSSYNYPETFDYIYNEVKYIRYDFNEKDSSFQLVDKTAYYYDENNNMKYIVTWDEDNQVRDRIYCYFDQLMIKCPSSSYSETVTVCADSSWTASTNVSWINLSRKSGSGRDTIVVSVNRNNTSEERFGSVTISSDSGFGLKTITSQAIIVSQVAGYNPDNYNLFPNPATTYFKLDDYGLKNVSVYNLQGDLILESKIYIDESISIGGLKAGVYLVKIENSDRTYTKRLVVK